MNTESKPFWSGRAVLENLAKIYEQLYLAPGEESEKHYPGVARGGRQAPQKVLSHFHSTDEDSCGFVSTPAGDVRVVTLQDRFDFETFLQIMAEGCRRVAIPPTQGAAILEGIINHRRIEQHKEQFYRAALEAGKPEPTWFEWIAEETRFTQNKENYTDVLIVLSTGPYSAVSPVRAGFEESEWLALSHTIRKYHECSHFVCRRFYPNKIDGIFDELVADAVGILAALGKYDMHLAELALGLENGAYVGGRLENYISGEKAEKLMHIGKILAKVHLVMETAQRLSEANANDPFALAISLENMKEALWDGAVTKQE